MNEKFELPKIGDILVKEFLEPLEITPYRLAKDLGVSTSSILDLVHNKRRISVEMSLRLARLIRILQQSPQFCFHFFVDWLDYVNGCGFFCVHRFI